MSLWISLAVAASCCCAVVLDSIVPDASPVYVLYYRNVAKMEDAKVEIDDGKDETVVPDTMYQ